MRIYVEQALLWAKYEFSKRGDSLFMQIID